MVLGQLVPLVSPLNQKLLTGRLVGLVHCVGVATLILFFGGYEMGILMHVTRTIRGIYQPMQSFWDMLFHVILAKFGHGHTGQVLQRDAPSQLVLGDEPGVFLGANDLKLLQIVVVGAVFTEMPTEADLAQERAGRVRLAF